MSSSWIKHSWSRSEDTRDKCLDVSCKPRSPNQIWIIYVSQRLLSAVSASSSSCHWTSLGQFWVGICPGSQTSPAEWMLCRDQSQKRSGKCDPTGTLFSGFTICWGICLGDTGVKLETVWMCTWYKNVLHIFVESSRLHEELKKHLLLSKKIQ